MPIFEIIITFIFKSFYATEVHYTFWYIVPISFLKVLLIIFTVCGICAMQSTLTSAK
jgi:hypothetical protein